MDAGCGAPERRQRLSTNRRPWSIRAMVAAGSGRTLSVSSVLSMVKICETLTTEGLDNPDSALAVRTLPGASASAKLDVITATMAVEMRLSLKGSDWITRTGLRKPGPEPDGGGKVAHQISPRFTAQPLELGVLERGINF